MNTKSVYFVILLIFLGVVIGTVSVGPGALIGSDYVKAEPDQKKVDYEGHWAEMYIEKAIVNGIVNGYPDGNFKPDEPVSRAAFVAIMDKSVRVAEIRKEEYPLTNFSDYTELPEWSKAGFRKAIYYDWLKPYSDGTIRPMSLLTLNDISRLISSEKLPVEIIKNKSDNAITRAEVCVLIPIIQENIVVQRGQ